ncbi:MAG: hypothetical protein ACFFDF_17035 [Candidatus Odinarchaeota archaeon]
MKLILKIKSNKRSKKKRLVAWIKKNSDFEDDIIQILRVFKDDIKLPKIGKILRYYIVTSRNPAIILNMFSTIQEIIPDIYFNNEDPIEIEDLTDKPSLS